MLIIDLETEKAAGLDEAKLAADVQWLLCPNPTVAHRHTPKPLREVRDELIEWLIAQKVGVDTSYKFSGFPNRISLCAFKSKGLTINFATVADFPLALALAAVRLLEEKQDEPC